MARSDPPRKQGSQPAAAEPHFMKLGKIVRPHGIRGEVCMEIYTAYPERLPHLETVYLRHSSSSTSTPYTLYGVRFHRGVALLTLQGIEDRNQADALRGQLVMIPFAEGAPLAESEIYVYQLLGLAVYTEAGDYLGKIKTILETGANDVFVLDGSERGEILIPDTEEVIRSIDLEMQKVIIFALPGLLD